MQRLEVSGAVRFIYKSLGVKGLIVAKEALLGDVQSKIADSDHQS